MSRVLGLPSRVRVGRKRGMRILVGCVLGLFTACAGAPEKLDLDITGVRARATPPGVRNGAVFFDLDNRNDRATALTGARASVAETVELHTHLHEGTVMRMRPVEEVALPPGTTAFAPGGFHVMLIGLHEPLRAGARFSLELRFRGGETRTVEVPVVALGGPFQAPASTPSSAPSSSPASAPSSSPASAPSSGPAGPAR
ncbi:MAG: copper chaperone PCu(A)C [Myxococcota bacterium]